MARSSVFVFMVLLTALLLPGCSKKAPPSPPAVPQQQSEELPVLEQNLPPAVPDWQSQPQISFQESPDEIKQLSKDERELMTPATD
ncbi:MAG TPA: hypothetical protein VL688_12645 [Verrucomicrobiae bacterium]|jgi:hypothetical protein|nr:hypothetical protein [Verrucomicrobiae bacterium]